ncbi:hypothetical protein [Vibrio sp. D431a]|uniref:hypothetical protein n=1 Tax=Vibrio sp. D431a TaxID=2837388 RepID=UPI00255787D5|nr:hypothetical protein [Vibrio sp. D431a]MDK9789936.1 hypothetical protein [Vibrio sp. D431a]
MITDLANEDLRSANKKLDQLIILQAKLERYKDSFEKRSPWLVLNGLFFSGLGFFMCWDVYGSESALAQIIENGASPFPFISFVMGLLALLMSLNIQGGYLRSRYKILYSEKLSDMLTGVEIDLLFDDVLPSLQGSEFKGEVIDYLIAVRCSRWSYPMPPESLKGKCVEALQNGDKVLPSKLLVQKFFFNALDDSIKALQSDVLVETEFARAKELYEELGEYRFK